jgi:hypothetical protein
LPDGVGHQRCRSDGGTGLAIGRGLERVAVGTGRHPSWRLRWLEGAGRTYSRTSCPAILTVPFGGPKVYQ